MEGFTLWGAPDIHVGGRGNLKEAIRLTDGRNLIFMLNHISNFDTSAFEMALRRMGFEEIVQKLIFLQGIKLDRNPAASLFLGGFNRIKVWPPNLDPKNEKEEKERIKLTRESLMLSKRALQEGFALGIYIQGGRSYTGKLTPAEPATIGYATLLPNTIIVPVGISGTEKVMPHRSPLPFPVSKVSVNFGEPINMDSLLKNYQNLPNYKKRKEVADFIMRKIAYRLPEEYRGIYG